MAQLSMSGDVAAFKPRPGDLLEQIRKLASDSRNVKFSEHALDRMYERDITALDAMRVLLSGYIDGSIDAGKNPGEWKCKIVGKRKGSRDIGVATIVMRTGKLYVKTVEWEFP